MKILITGGAGFIGSNLVPRLASLGHDVLVGDNLSAGQGRPQFPPKVEFRCSDFTDPQMQAEYLGGTHVVVHLAAMSGVIDSISNPDGCFATNVAGTFRLLDMARQANVKQFINASTGGAILGEVVPPISEAIAPAPLSPYGASKLAIEGFCSAYSASYGLPCVSLRFSNIYGPHSAHKKSVVAAFIKSVLSGKPLLLYGDGTQRRDYLFVDDLVKGIIAVIGRRLNGTFQLGSGKPTSILELVRALESIVGRKLEIEYRPRRTGEIHSTWCNIERAIAAFGYAAPTPLHDGLCATRKWFVDNASLWRREPVAEPASRA
jgi:UDP-glucose 4-epimerase